MKKLMILPLTLMVVTLYAQSAKLSTFEEMWIVRSEFLNTDVKSSTSLAPESMIYETFKGVTSYEDLNKIIADTPFLSLELSPTKERSTRKAKDLKNPQIILGERLGPGKSLKGWGSWLLVFKKGDRYSLGIPSMEAEKLSKLLTKDNFLITDEKGKLQNMTIHKVSLHNL